jgi:hypothetical protein
MASCSSLEQSRSEINRGGTHAGLYFESTHASSGMCNDQSALSLLLVGIFWRGGRCFPRAFDCYQQVVVFVFMAHVSLVEALV